MSHWLNWNVWFFTFFYFMIYAYDLINLYVLLIYIQKQINKVTYVLVNIIVFKIIIKRYVIKMRTTKNLYIFFMDLKSHFILRFLRFLYRLRTLTPDCLRFEEFFVIVSYTKKKMRETSWKKALSPHIHKVSLQKDHWCLIVLFLQGIIFHGSHSPLCH